MAYHPYIDIFKVTGDHVSKTCSLCKPEADSNFHLYAAVCAAIDKGQLDWAGTYIAILTGKRPVAARQFILVGERNSLLIFAPSCPSVEDIERWDPYNVIRKHFTPPVR